MSCRMSKRAHPRPSVPEPAPALSTTDIAAGRAPSVATVGMEMPDPQAGPRHTNSERAANCAQNGRDRKGRSARRRRQPAFGWTGRSCASATLAGTAASKSLM